MVTANNSVNSSELIIWVRLQDFLNDPGLSVPHRACVQRKLFMGKRIRSLWSQQKPVTNISWLVLGEGS